jgi:prophage antirepressor-like protein
MENKIEIFKNEELGEVRSLIIDGEPWFVGKDVAKGLGYTDTDQAIRKHVFEEDKAPRRIDGIGYSTQVIIINESGMYALIFGSELDSAKKFKRWVTKDVLPSIRKHGLYITEELLKDKEKLQQQLDSYWQEYYELENKTNELELENKIIESKNEELEEIKKEYATQQNAIFRLSIKTKEEESYLPRLTLELIRMYIKENPDVVINEREDHVILKARPLYKELRKLIMCNNKNNSNIYEMLYTMNIYDNDTTVAIPVKYLDENYNPMFKMHILNW